MPTTRPFWYTLVAALFVATSATGHDLPRERTMLIEISKTGVEAMVVYREPPGRRVQLLKSQFDVDGDGRLTGGEADAASGTWLEYALQDLDVRIDGESRNRETSKVKFRNEHNGALSAAIYLTWNVPEIDAGDERVVSVRRSSDSPSFTSLVRCQVQTGVELLDAPGTVEAGKAGPTELAPGDTLEFRALRRGEGRELPTRRP